MPGPLPHTTQSDNPQPGQHKVLGTYRATAYCNKFGPASINGTGVTAGGTDLRDGSQHYVIAAGVGSGLSLGDKVTIDPNPFGSGTVFLVDDHGGAIVGHHIDIYIADCKKAQQWGSRSVRLSKVADTSGVGVSKGDNALQTAANAISAPFKGIDLLATAVEKFVEGLFSSALWFRIGKVLVGLFLGGLGLTILVRKAGGNVPVPIPV